MSENASNGPIHARHFVGSSGTMQRMQRLVKRVANSDASVLIHGETGTGKELVARALHEAGPRMSGPFVAINCAAVPATLLEAELFGHARGAFTDAKSARDGLFVQASGGVLFLDEIGEMPLEMQAKLLRALQERTVRPVGSSVDVAFDARVLSSTHRDLDAMVESGEFRRDLYYRLNVVTIEIPALRDRGNDIIELAAFLLERAGTRDHRGHLDLSSAAAACLLAYAWPGNVRELENVMERAVALSECSSLLRPDDLPDRLRAPASSAPIAPIAPVASTSPLLERLVTLDENERRYIAHVLHVQHGNKTRAAEILGIDRRTLYRRTHPELGSASPAVQIDVVGTPAAPRWHDE